MQDIGNLITDLEIGELRIMERFISQLVWKRENEALNALTSAMKGISYEPAS